MNPIIFRKIYILSMYSQIAKGIHSSLKNVNYSSPPACQSRDVFGSEGHSWQPVSPRPSELSAVGTKPGLRSVPMRTVSSRRST